MKPATQFLLAGVATVIVLTTMACAASWWQVDRVAAASTLRQVQVASTVERELEANRLAELQLRADMLAQDSAFVDYVAQSLIPNPQLGGSVDRASISDLLQERRKGYDIAMVLDPQGAPVATSGILLKDHQSIRHDPLVTRAITRLKSQQGVWVDHGQLLWVAVSPLLRGGVLQGVLVTASHVDNSFAVAIRRISGVDVGLLMEPSPGAAPPPSSGLDRWTEQTLAARLPEVLAVREYNGRAMELADGQGNVLVWVMPMNTSGGRAALVAAGPENAGGLFDPGFLPWLLGALVFGAVALLLLLVQWRRTWLPLQRVLDIIERVNHGDPNLTIRAEGSAIVRLLRDGINQLLRRTG